MGKDIEKGTLQASEVAEIIQHMNEDHADSLLLYARHYGGFKDALAASLIDVDNETCSLLVKKQVGSETAVINLKRPVLNIKEAERVMVEMHFDALKAETPKAAQ